MRTTTPAEKAKQLPALRARTTTTPASMPGSEQVWTPKTPPETKRTVTVPARAHFAVEEADDQKSENNWRGGSFGFRNHSFMAASMRRFTRSFSMFSRTPQVPVTLHVYSVGQSTAVNTINGLLRLFGTGAYHAAVEVYGAEWSYGYTHRGTGVFECLPGACDMHIYREQVDLGILTMSREEVLEIINQITLEYPGSDYDLLKKNCCTFANDFVKRLGLPPIPPWVLNLSTTGAKAIDIVGEERVSSMGETACKAVDKVVEAIALGASERGQPNSNYKFGDLTRGLIAVGRQRRTGRTCCCLCDCFHGIRASVKQIMARRQGSRLT